jgi:pimeloyl-ACP methyl ester carboxylesterase
VDLKPSVEETLSWDGGEARVLRVRGGEGPLLVLVHGAGGNHRSFDALLPGLGGLDVLLPALPGRCGSSGEAAEDARASALWLLDVLDRAGIDRFVIGGHSYGGAVAIECALEVAGRAEGARLVGLVLMATGARLRVNPGILAMAEEAARRGEPMLFGETIFRPGADPARIRAYEAASARTPPRAALADWRACNAFDRLQDVKRIDVPTLVVCGSEDTLTPPKYAGFLASNIPGARLSTVPGAGHMLPVEDPDALGALLCDFVAERRA